MVKSDYEKLLRSLDTYSELSTVTTIPQLIESIRKANEYISGVPWEYMSPENRRKLESIVNEYIENRVEESKERIIQYWRENTPRYRPSFERILEYILDHLEYYEALEKAKEDYGKTHELYREIAGDLNISWRTVRDAIWTFRSAGIW